MKTVVKCLSSFFYLGHVPYIPGFFGSLGGLLFYLLVSYSFTLYIGSLVVLTLLAFLVINKAEEIYGKKDAKPIVIDEAVGMMLALFLIPTKPLAIILAFIFFRLFDVLKPFPIKWAERQSSPLGVMLDDIISGIYANLSVQVLCILATKSGV